MTKLSDSRVPGGGVGRQVTLGGATDTDGLPAGPVIVKDNPPVDISGSESNTLYIDDTSTAADAVDGTTVYESGDISPYNFFMFTITSAAATGFKILPSYDGTTFQTADTDRLAAYDVNTGALVVAATLATTAIVGSFYIKDLKIRAIRIVQIGAAQVAIDYAHSVK